MRMIFFIFLMSSCLFSFGQITIPNSGFEQTSKAYFTGSFSWSRAGKSDICSIDSSTVWKGRYSFHILKKTAGEIGTLSGLGMVYQEFSFHSKGLRKFKLSASIKTSNVKEKSAGLFAKVTDKEGRVICRQDMIDSPISGSNDWKVYETEFYANDSASKLKIAGSVIGSGEAWFDDFNIIEIPLGKEPPTPVIDKYLEDYFHVVKQNSIVKDDVLITRLQKQAKALCAGNSSLVYAHYILKNITLNLNDGHSFLLTPEEWKSLADGDKAIQEGFLFGSGKLIGGNIAYINLPGVSTSDSILSSRFVDSLQTVVARLDQLKPSGWIIDLSHNESGNCWLMISGLGPLIGNGICGYSVSANGKKISRIYNEGWAGWDTTCLYKKAKPYHVINQQLPIAVIYGDSTVSSGEVMAIIFRGKANTRSFGQETWGSTTRIDNFELSDGAYLNLASGIDADRNGVLFGHKITPDVITKNTDTALEEAKKWILEQKK